MATKNYIATARDDIFAGRVALVLARISLDVAVENPATPNHANRLALAHRVFRTAVNNKAAAATMIASSTSIQTSIDNQPLQLGKNVGDADLLSALTAIYDHLANAYAAGL